MEIKISTLLNPTENSKKLIFALEKFFPEIKFKTTKKSISGSSDKINSLDLLREKILQKQIKSTVRYLLLEYKTVTGTKLGLNKQALIRGRINFVEEKYPLGNVNIEIKDDVEHTVNYLIGIKNE